MDKWKIVVIVVLLGALGGYGWYQQNAAQNPAQNVAAAPDPSTPASTQPAPTPANTRLNSLKGQTPPAWNIAKPLWKNTAAPVSLASLKGSVAIVEFWRIGCSHCRDAAPFLNSLYVKNKARGLKIVALHSPGLPDSPGNMPNPENNWAIVQQTAGELGITYPIAQDVGGQLFKEAYGGQTYPTLMILDRNSKVQFIMTGHTPQKEIELVAALNAALDKK